MSDYFNCPGVAMRQSQSYAKENLFAGIGIFL